MSLPFPLPAPHRPAGSLAPFVWYSPTTSLEAQDLWNLACPAGLPLGDQGRFLLRAAGQSGARGAALVGAIPFDPLEAATLRMAPQPRWGLPRPPAPLTPAPLAAVRGLTSVPSGADYEALVARAVAALQTGLLDKVVLGRVLHLDLAGPLALAPLVAQLAGQNPAGYTFALELAPDRHLLGASPELLVSKRGPTLRLRPMAGTRPRLADPDADAAQAANLQASGKDLAEHALMVDAIRATLAPLCRRLEVPAAPQVISAGTLWHLATPIVAELEDPACTVLDVVERLHPTPAVCGVPQGAAHDFIGTHEPGNRGLFAGAVGWCDAQGDGEWAVTIRCAEVTPQQVRLFAGAGVVAASDPASERAETAAKFRTMLGALGVQSGEELGAL
ncbi:isochorismate synthase [Deinococcus sp. HMF7604]|uniref:isochorismate synthase n=1 Tax=Deinococcus betulae TaxID=2873312 RepID=UPI001CCA876F|nr:isochorismate synthase [Deinococcus betulae]MBZ9750135.1 isochorismate synthase [Deinococcus betulae]